MRGGGAVSHPGVGNIGGASNRWLTAAQRLSNSAIQGEPGTTNAVRSVPAHQIATANRGEPWEDPGIAVVDPTWDYRTVTQKKRKSNSRKGKTHGGGARSEGGGFYFSINRIVEILWPQTAPDKLTAECLWTGLCVFQSWIYSTNSRQVFGGGLDDMQRSAWETDAGVFGNIPAGLNLLATPPTL